MTYPEIHQQPSARETAEVFSNWLWRQVCRSQIFHWALSGGSTPQMLFKHLARTRAGEPEWERVHFWWGDERCVGPDDPESNFGMTRKFLFDKLSLRPEQIHRVLGEAEPEGEAQRYAEEIRQWLPVEEGLPRFDLMMLGMGADGHTASIFPSNRELLDDPRLCAVARHPESGQLRVSLTGPVIAASRRIAFLVTGEQKAPVLRSILVADAESLQYPAARFRSAYWFVDQDALRDLPADRR
jgi:6-phosphogluconolactonase